MVRRRILSVVAAGIVAIDQAAVFPSIGRRYIYWILWRMQVQWRIRKVFVELSTGGMILSPLVGELTATSQLVPE